MSSSIASSAKDGEKGRLYGFEVPPLRPGDYEIVTKQVVSSDNDRDQVLLSTQPVKVKTTQPYGLSPELVHSYYPPSMRRVSATTLPHIVLKGATAWERSNNYNKGTAPTPWLALLLFREGDLSAPPEVLSSAVRPSGTKALTLPLDLVNNNYTKFCQTKPFPKDEIPATTDGSPATADFIFVNSKAFSMYFDRQDSSKTGAQTKVDLERYQFLTLMTDTGVDDGTGHANAKLSTLIGHRTRPYDLSTEDEKVHAHLVSIEDLENRIDWKAAQSTTAAIALVSLFSWTFSWEKHIEKSGLDMFEHLGRTESTRSLAITIPKEVNGSALAMPWVKERIMEGYTIVRHRDIAGEASMALYRGPLTPQHTRRPRIGPSIHGTDLQIIDVSAQILDVSYSTAWELGRSLAGRDAKFSAAMAGLRRKLCLHAVTNSKRGEYDNAKQVMHQAGDVVGSVLKKLDDLFQKPMTERIKGLPLNGKDDKATRWQVPQHTATTTAAAPGSMTDAKLRRHLESFAQKWIGDETLKLCENPTKQSVIPELAVVFNWIINNLMSLKLVPATYLFPDPAVIADESINCFLVDDVWVDALVDGAMSLANTMGGRDDPVREQIRMAFNIYLDNAPPSLVPIGASGFVLKSGVVESFPDLDITVTTTKPGAKMPTPLACSYRAKNENMIIYLVARGEDRKLANYTVQFKLPPHQQRFSIDPMTKDQMTFTFELAPYLIQENRSLNLDEVAALTKPVTWNSQGKVTKPAGAKFAPLWSWDTGILVPRLVAEVTDIYIDEVTKKYPMDKIAKDSTSLYLATQLTDRDHSILIPFVITEGQELTTRQLFPKHVPPEPDTRDPALEHPQANSTATNMATGKSWFTKQAFSQDFPGESIPAESNATQHIVFSIKATDKETLPSDTEVLDMEISIPLGETASHLLDPMAPLPAVKALGLRQQWIAALTRRKSINSSQRVIEELVVHLKPRGGGGATLMKGLDASFVLLRATVNGVVGYDVEIKVKERYRKKSPDTEGEKEHVLSPSTTVQDSWLLVKE